MLKSTEDLVVGDVINIAFVNYLVVHQRPTLVNKKILLTLIPQNEDNQIECSLIIPVGVNIETISD